MESASCVATCYGAAEYRVQLVSSTDIYLLVLGLNFCKLPAHTGKMLLHITTTIPPSGRLPLNTQETFNSGTYHAIE